MIRRYACEEDLACLGVASASSTVICNGCGGTFDLADWPRHQAEAEENRSALEAALRGLLPCVGQKVCITYYDRTNHCVRVLGQRTVRVMGFDTERKVCRSPQIRLVTDQEVPVLTSAWPQGAVMSNCGIELYEEELATWPADMAAGGPLALSLTVRLRPHLQGLMPLLEATQ